MLSALLVLGLFNGLILLPVLLSVFGPPAELIPEDKADQLSPDDLFINDSPPQIKEKQTPSPLNQSRRSQPMNNRRLKINKPVPSRLDAVPRRHNSDISLSTIPEESQSHLSTVSPQSSLNGGYVSPQSSLNTASVFVEPEVVVETTTYPANLVSFENYIANKTKKCNLLHIFRPIQQVRLRVQVPIRVRLQRPLSPK